MTSKKKALASANDTARSILPARGHRVLLDSEPPELCGITKARLNHPFCRNFTRLQCESAP